MSEDVKQVGKDFAVDFATSAANQAVNKLTSDDDKGGGGDTSQEIRKINDPSLQSQIALMDIQNTQTQLNLETAAELDRVQREFYTTQDIRKGQSEGTQSRLGQMLGGEQQRLSARVAGQEQRAGFAEQAAQQRASARVAGQEQRAGMAETGTQQRATKRVEGQEVRATDLQREQFRRYKEARDYGQAQSAYKA